MKLIPLTQGYFAKVDNSDFIWLSKYEWCLCKGRWTNYAKRGEMIDGKEVTIRMHRQILNTPKGVKVDHKDHDGLNCQRFNIRNCTTRQNNMNKTTWGKSKYIGVSIRKKDIVAQIQIDGKKKHLGCFRTELAAAIAYDAKAIELFGEFANLNFK
jgi:hypothetical protein